MRDFFGIFGNIFWGILVFIFFPFILFLSGFDIQIIPVSWKHSIWLSDIKFLNRIAYRMIQKFSKITLIFIFVNLYTLNILRLYSESNISFRTKLRGRCRYFSYIPGLYTGVGIHLNNISQQNSTCVITADLHWHIIIIQSPKFPLHFTFGVVHSMSLDKCLMTL